MRHSNILWRIYIKGTATKLMQAENMKTMYYLGLFPCTYNRMGTKHTSSLASGGKQARFLPNWISLDEELWVEFTIQSSIDSSTAQTVVGFERQFCYTSAFLSHTPEAYNRFLHPPSSLCTVILPSLNTFLSFWKISCLRYSEAKSSPPKLSGNTMSFYLRALQKSISQEFFLKGKGMGSASKVTQMRLAS